MTERKTRILHELQGNPEDACSMTPQGSDASMLLRIISESNDPATRSNAAVMLGELAGTGRLSDGELRKLQQLYAREKDIKTAAGLLRVINKQKLHACIGRDITQQYDRKLSIADRRRVQEELKKLKVLYDRAAGREGSFDDKYTIFRHIAEGGMGKVYKGVRKADNCMVAIKFLLEEFSDSPGIIARFERESSILLGMNHPNIVKVFERGMYDRKYFIIMEYIDGGCLDSFIGKPSLTPALAMDIFKQVCAGLQYIHERGIVHRDMKPGNVLLDWKNNDDDGVTAKISDFGLAKDIHASRLTNDFTRAGTDYYVSPEQRLAAKDADHRADIYSLGVMMYEILTGGLFPAGNYQQVYEINPAVPPELDLIIEKCRKEKPNERWESVKEILEKLNALTA